MIVDVDIRISNDEGIPVQNFTKRFDGRFEGSRRFEIGSVSGKSFEEFLAEYLSGSGRCYRENLLSDRVDSKIYTYHSGNVKDNENLEYYIKIGDSQTITGKIPLKRIGRLTDITKISVNTNSDSEKREFLNNEIHEKNKNAVEFVSKLLETAINRYEESFLHEYAYDTEEFVG